MNYKPRILMFAPLCYPPAGSEAIVTSKLVLAMLNAGWEIDVISQSDFGQRYPANGSGIWEPVRRVVHGIPAFKDRSLARGVKLPTIIQSLSWAGKAIAYAKRLTALKKYDFILSRATPLYGHLPALFIAKNSRIPWIANWSDPLPHQKAPAPYGNGPKASMPFYIDTYCAKIARNALWHTFPCERLRDYVTEYLPDIKEKSSAVPHIALKQFCRNTERASSTFVMCHVGNLTNRDPYVFLEAFRQFREKVALDRDVAVTFVGPQSARLDDIVRRIGVSSNIRISLPKSYEDSQKIMGESAVLVLIESSCEEGIFFPSKLVDYVQTGRPVLALSPDRGTVNDLMVSANLMLPASNNSPEHVAESIEALFEAWRAGNLDAMYGSSHLLEKFSENTILEAYKALFDRITDGV